MGLLGRYGLWDIGNTGAVRIDTREEHCPTRGTTGGSVEVCKSDPPCGQGIDGRRGNFAAVDADIGKPQVVCENQNNVGSVIRHRESGGNYETKKN